ncbi:hypothetical protein BXZ70DRAFT_1010221 [Cristinia sonorae]|uniref:MYND-type domain-containing protein n=1 Tax=Cristinia sonorae TaxID=1940300 RepID=A0A8K0UIW7_9AGAR|nr:hypothetical protein BXZ70DRAFT_1010221 [Cristinia sonorae]
MAFLKLSKTRPDKYTDRALWNESWEKDMKIYETFRDKGIPDLSLGGSSPSLKSSNLDELCRDLLTLQSDVRRKAITRLATDQFAEKWADLPAEKRMDHILEALFRTCTASPDFEDFRKWCPDMTVEGLGRDPGSYMDLLGVLTDGVDGQLTVFPHPVVDAILERLRQRSPNAEVFLEMLRLGRTNFVTMVLWRVYLSFHDLDEFLRLKVTGSKKSVKETARNIQSSLKTPQQKKDFRRIRRSILEGGNICWGCGNDERLLKAGTTLLACSGCKKIDQRVLYCSRECQKNDWKVGVANNSPHKQVCGKPWAADSENSAPRAPLAAPRAPGAPQNTFMPNISPRRQPITSERMVVPQIIPPADPEFRRSPALQYQIRLLTKKPDVFPDYTLVMDHPKPDMGISVPDPQVATYFICARTRAFRNGDPASVHTMFTMLKRAAAMLAPPTYSLKKQLEKEFNVDLDQAAGQEWPSPIGAELESAVDIVCLSQRSPVMVQ